MRICSVILPIRTVTEGNAKEHWRTKATRAKRQRTEARYRMAVAMGRSELRAPPYVVHMTRVSCGRLDDDNLRGALKHVRDGVADWLGVDDGDEAAVEWRYEQSHGARGSWAVVVDVANK